jgi:hypothetical protein
VCVCVRSGGEGPSSLYGWSKHTWADAARPHCHSPDVTRFRVWVAGAAASRGGRAAYFWACTYRESGVLEGHCRARLCSCGTGMAAIQEDEDALDVLQNGGIVKSVRECLCVRVCTCVYVCVPVCVCLCVSVSALVWVCLSRCSARVSLRAWAHCLTCACVLSWRVCARLAGPPPGHWPAARAGCHCDGSLHGTLSDYGSRRGRHARHWPSHL